VQLLQSLELDERARGTASSLLNEVRNLSDMVTSFLNFARPQPLEFDEVDLDELITDCGSELMQLFAERNVKLAIERSGNFSAKSQRPLRLGGEVAAEKAHRRDAGGAEDAQRFIIRADERMLRQALLNLIRNAAEAIPNAQTDRRVEVSSSIERDHAGKGWAVIQVKDTGEGIPAADLQRIFIPFFTTKASGHGVGLALAHRVVTQHGGTLSAANAKDGGALFSVRLPV
jgi:signal transduction histidine kinase